LYYTCKFDVISIKYVIIYNYLRLENYSNFWLVINTGIKKPYFRVLECTWLLQGVKISISTDMNVNNLYYYIYGFMQYYKTIQFVFCDNIGLLHEYWWILSRTVLSRAVYHIARVCKCNMIHCEGQYSPIFMQ
jgi:hypothetical protein